jgi:hypothetical protein
LGASLGHDEDESEEGSVYWGYSRTAFWMLLEMLSRL